MGKWLATRQSPLLVSQFKGFRGGFSFLRKSKDAIHYAPNSRAVRMLCCSSSRVNADARESFAHAQSKSELTFDSQMAERKKRPPYATPHSPTAKYQDLDPALQLRIRRTLITCGVWFTLVISSAGLFVLSKPLMDRRRLERMSSGVEPQATPKPKAYYAQNSPNR